MVWRPLCLPDVAEGGLGEAADDVACEGVCGVEEGDGEGLGGRLRNELAAEGGIW